MHIILYIYDMTSYDAMRWNAVKCDAMRGLPE